MTTSLTGCSNRVEKVTGYIAEQNYEEALEYYKNKIKDKDLEALAEALREIILALPEQFAADEIEYEQARGLLDTIDRMHLGSLSEDLVVVRAKVQTLDRSRQAFQLAEQAFADGDYLAAARSYRGVDPIAPCYQQAVDKLAESLAAYEAAVLQEANALATAHDFDGAIHLLREATSNLEDPVAFETRIAELEDEKEEYRLAEERRVVIAEAEQEAGRGKLEEALTILQNYETESGDTSEELAAVHAQYRQEYVDSVLTQVQDLIDQNEYVQALNILEHARQVAPSEQFDELLAQIEAVKPIYLTDLNSQSNHNFETLISGADPRDSLGNTYSIASGNLFQISSKRDSWAVDDGFVEYSLGSNYSRISGVVAVDDESDDVTTELTIAGDDVVLYTIPLSRHAEPTPVSIDISAVNVLSIQIAASEDVGEVIAILSDFQLEK